MTPHILVMGVSGCGKTTVARALAQALHREYIDADPYHPEENLAKMNRGEPLTDNDRAGWLAILTEVLARQTAAGKPVVLACSALKKAYRDQLARGGAFRVIYLKGSRELLAARLGARKYHFFNPVLLDSQLADLEEPSDACTLDVAKTEDEVVAEAVAWVGSSG